MVLTKLLVEGMSVCLKLMPVTAHHADDQVCDGYCCACQKIKTCLGVNSLLWTAGCSSVFKTLGD